MEAYGDVNRAAEFQSIKQFCVHGVLFKSNFKPGRTCLAVTIPKSGTQIRVRNSSSTRFFFKKKKKKKKMMQHRAQKRTTKF